MTKIVAPPNSDIERRDPKHPNIILRDPSIGHSIEEVFGPLWEAGVKVHEPKVRKNAWQRNSKK